jgi:hypothetical protein
MLSSPLQVTGPVTARHSLATATATEFRIEFAEMAVSEETEGGSADTAENNG